MPKEKIPVLLLRWEFFILDGAQKNLEGFEKLQGLNHFLNHFCKILF